MIRLCLIGNSYKYELENIIKLFFPGERVTTEKAFDTAQITAQKDGLALSVTLFYQNVTTKQTERAEGENDCERLLCQMLFLLLCERTGIRPAWGIQTGVRPVKLLRRLVLQNGWEKAEQIFKEKFLITDEKFQLAKQTLQNQERLLQYLGENTFSLYISIPFCVSRCSYCSFISHDVEKSAKLIPSYIDRLCEEIEHTGKIARQLGLRLLTVYIGGGTPTAISAQALQKVCDAVHKNFETEHLLEFTIEAGRPDTITPEKLDVMRDAGATRISINPQTLNDAVLKEIRRNHTKEDFYRAYDMAVQKGFDNINTDLIAGLGKESVASFQNTIAEIIKLDPACVTVHTLAVKRSSRLVYQGQAQYRPQDDAVSQMLSFSHTVLAKAGYRPYYMYRQSAMAGNNENIGWAKPGYESYYNVFIMEEMQTILAVGAGASTKLVSENGEKIQRIFNYKYPYEYISGFDEMKRRKEKILAFYTAT